MSTLNKFESDNRLSIMFVGRIFYCIKGLLPHGGLCCTWEEEWRGEHTRSNGDRAVLKLVGTEVLRQLNLEKSLGEKV